MVRSHIWPEVDQPSSTDGSSPTRTPAHRPVAKGMRRNAGLDINDNLRKRQRHTSMAKSIAATASELVSIRQRQRSAQRRIAYQIDQVNQVCFVLFVMTSPSATLALAYADHARRQGKSVQNITAETLQEQYVQTTIEDLANIMAGEQVDPKVLRAARRFAREQQLHEWIQWQNKEKGLAPGSARILQAAQQFEQDPEKGHDWQRNSGSLPARTKWMQRFAKRWQLRKGTIQAGERIPQEEAKAKVSGCEQ